MVCARPSSPAIHILAGEKVCIHVINPTQFFALFASVHNSVIAPGVVTTGLNATFTGILPDCESDCAISAECSATFFSAASPYKCWLPVTNHTSNSLRSVIIFYSLFLSVAFMIAFIPFFGFMGRNLPGLADLHGQMHGFRHVFDHHGRL